MFQELAKNKLRVKLGCVFGERIYQTQRQAEHFFQPNWFRFDILLNHMMNENMFSMKDHYGKPFPSTYQLDEYLKYGSSK